MIAVQQANRIAEALGLPQRFIHGQSVTLDLGDMFVEMAERLAKLETEMEAMTEEDSND